MNEQKELNLKRRLKTFALDIIQLVRMLPREIAAIAIARQIVRSGTSIAANYRAACRGKSKADFIAKLGIAEEEADETLLWLELIEESKMLPDAIIAPAKKEAEEI